MSTQLLAGHMGIKKTINRITERFMWPGIVKDVKAMVHLILFNGTQKFPIYCVCRMPGVGGAVMTRTWM